jgi:hypothetical protein
VAGSDFIPVAKNSLQEDKIVGAVRRWVESVVVALNLCPFAGRVLLQDQIRFVVTEANTEEQLLADLQYELTLLVKDSTVETTLLILPGLLQEFSDYNQFLEYADDLLIQMDLEGVYQVASFHPQYQFDGTETDDVENFTNRSPYPMLHLIREQSLDRALANYPDADQIPLRNIERMKGLGKDRLIELMQACFDTNTRS